MLELFRGNAGVVHCLLVLVYSHAHAYVQCATHTSHNRLLMLCLPQITDETDTWEETGSRRGPRREELGASMSLFDHKVGI